MRAVYKKELSQYFNSMVGYVYLAIFLFLSGYYFVVGNLLAGNGDIRNYFSSIITVVMFLLPMLTMRSFAEERKMRTEQLLLASPVSSAGVVMGKYLAVLSVFALGVLFTLLYVLVLALFGQFDIWVILGNYLGIFIAASSFIAIGMLLSALTENQVVACVITYCTLLCLWLVGYAGTYLTSPFAKML
ncbi:MAG: ABC transporter permease, partial [Ruthenibacterium sp.]